MSNVAKKSSGFVHIPYSFMRLETLKNGKQRKLNETELTVCSAIFGYQKKDEDGNYTRESQFTYQEIVERYGFSRAAVARALKLLMNNKLIERGEKKSIYHCMIDTENKYLSIENWLREATFTLDGADYRLTKKELRVLSYLISVTNEGNKNPYESSVKAIAGVLKISRPTVSSALQRLKELKLISISGVAKNARWKARYYVHGDKIRAKRKSFVRQYRHEKAVQNEADARADREHYYAVLRQRDQDRLDRIEGKANSDPEYREAASAIRRLDVQIAHAELRNLPELENLRKEYDEAQRVRIRRMDALKIVEEDLLPHYVCKKCHDKGFLPNGRACNCYPGRRRE